MKSKHIDLVINQDLLYNQCKTLAALEKWQEVIDICETRLALLKERRNLYSRYEQGEYTDEEAKAFHFLNGKGSELYNLAWNSEYRRLESEEQDAKETLKLAKRRNKNK